MVAIIDFGGQYTHLIARRLRQLHARAEIFPSNTNLAKVKDLEGVILSGGPMSVYNKLSPKTSIANLKLSVPILGICYGHQFLAKNLGGMVKRGYKSEFGKESLKLKTSRLFRGLKPAQSVWFSHGDQVTKLPSGFRIIASSQNCKIAAFEGKKTFGVQFHPEVTHTENGLKILKNFLTICQAKKDWRVNDQVEGLISKLKQEIKGEKVLVAVSGGVDSLVVATLIKSAIGDKIYPIFVDSGLLRRGETTEVKKLFRDLKFKNFRFVDSSKLFLQRLKTITEPEKKRTVIGKTFIEVFSREAERLGN